MIIILLEPLPADINGTFNANHPVGSFFNLTVSDNNEWHIKINGSDVYPIFNSEKKYFKVLEP